MTIQEVRDVGGRRPRARHGGGPTMALLVGGLCGLAWAAGLRGFMAQIAGSEWTVGWAGTFGWRWLALSPLLFSAILFSRPLDMLSILEDGLGDGAIGVPLYGMLGGYALSGRGPRWAWPPIHR